MFVLINNKTSELTLFVRGHGIFCNIGGVHYVNVYTALDFLLDGHFEVLGELY